MRLAAVLALTGCHLASGLDDFDVATGAGGVGAGGCANQVLEFDGVDDSVLVPQHDDFNSLDMLTVEAWIRLSPDVGMSEVHIVSHHDQVENTGFALLVREQKLELRYLIGVPGGLEHVVTGDAPLPVDTWIHVAGVYDGTALSIYAGGVPLSRKEAVALLGAYSGPLRIGSRAQPGMFNFEGRIDEVRLTRGAVYTGAYTPAPRLGPDPATVALWHFDDPVQDVADATFTHPGTLGSDALTSIEDPTYQIDRCPP